MSAGAGRMLFHLGSTEGLCQEILERCHLHLTVEEQAQREQTLKKEELGRAPVLGCRRADETSDEPEWRPERRWIRNSSKKDTSNTTEISTLGHLLGEARIKCKEQRPCSSRGY